ncbi:MAG TPA: hypothetical protein VKU80_17520 [Planctomycetota bacterium]|nr:hypothetical protein [Planctomycetota bacterium]
MEEHLEIDEEGGTAARLTNDGTLTSLGTAHSRLKGSPFAVFQIASFAGLDIVDQASFEAEILRRYSTKELANLIGRELDNEEVLDLLARRMKR